MVSRTYWLARAVNGRKRKKQRSQVNTFDFIGDFPKNEVDAKGLVRATERNRGRNAQNKHSPVLTFQSCCFMAISVPMIIPIALTTYAMRDWLSASRVNFVRHRSRVRFGHVGFIVSATIVTSTTSFSSHLIP